MEVDKMHNTIWHLLEKRVYLSGVELVHRPGMEDLTITFKENMEPIEKILRRLNIEDEKTFAYFLNGPYSLEKIKVFAAYQQGLKDGFKLYKLEKPST